MYSDMGSAAKAAASQLWLHPPSLDHPGFPAEQLGSSVCISPGT